jgi:hypothetical protein
MGVASDEPNVLKRGDRSTTSCVTRIMLVNAAWASA